MDQPYHVHTIKRSLASSWPFGFPNSGECIMPIGRRDVNGVFGFSVQLQETFSLVRQPDGRFFPNTEKLAIKFGHGNHPGVTLWMEIGRHIDALVASRWILYPFLSSITIKFSWSKQGPHLHIHITVFVVL